MAMLAMQIADASGARRRTVEAPGDIAVNRLIVLLVEKMELPINSPDGQIMSYKLNHRRSGRQLLDRETLDDAGVRNGDELRLQAEITAGTPGAYP